MENGRHELKFQINAMDAQLLLTRLPRIMRPDENAGGEKGYRVRSLYFDTPYDKALHEKLAGTQPRDKFRLRLYNGDSRFIRLEKKSKIHDLCVKRNAIMEYAQCACLIGGDPRTLLSGDTLQKELYARMRGELLRPRCIVDYGRTAFLYPPGNVRVTIDHDIRVSDKTIDFLDADYISRPTSNTIVLEVKYDHFLPEVIRALVALSSRQPTAFSKYSCARLGF